MRGIISRFLFIVLGLFLLGTYPSVVGDIAAADSTTHSVENYHAVYYFPPNPPPDYIFSPYWSNSDVTSVYTNYNYYVGLYETIAGGKVWYGNTKRYDIEVNVQEVKYTNNYGNWILESGDFSGYPVMCSPENICHWEHNSSEHNMSKYELSVHAKIFIAHPDCNPMFTYDEPNGPIP